MIAINLRIAIVILAAIIVSLFRGCASPVVISVIKFDHLRACLLRYSPADLLPGSLYVQTCELTLRVPLNARFRDGWVIVK